MRPSFIRVDADEATYNMHIILRFELEQDFLAGTIASARTCPEAWNTRFEEYLGLAVPNDTLGVLQDIHWSGGGFGYFPTYSLGNIVSVQIWERALSERPTCRSSSSGSSASCTSGCGRGCTRSGASSRRRRRSTVWSGD